MALVLASTPIEPLVGGATKWATFRNGIDYGNDMNPVKGVKGVGWMNYNTIPRGGDTQPNTFYTHVTIIFQQDTYLEVGLAHDNGNLYGEQYYPFYAWKDDGQTYFSNACSFTPGTSHTFSIIS
ncbi:MAG: hypothetical protein QW057_08010 [Candidatus Bathyarchaeia archaeon]